MGKIHQPGVSIGCSKNFNSFNSYLLKRGKVNHVTSGPTVDGNMDMMAAYV